MSNPKQRIREIEQRLEELPKGTLTYKTINGKKQPYVQRTIEGKSVSYYVKVSEREQILLEFEERGRLQEERQHLLAYQKKLATILAKNPYLSEPVGMGHQNFRDFIDGKMFYVDKTQFISEWMQTGDKVTLITRPRRFGKTLILSTVETFFDPRYVDHPEYFKELKVWKDPACRTRFGSTPVIFASFGNCKGRDYKQAMRGLMFSLYHMFRKHNYLLDSDKLDDTDKAAFREYEQGLFHDEEDKVEKSISVLCELLYKHCGVLPYILLDEYDTPLLEAYTDGYWEEMISICRRLFHGTFKENGFYSRAIITGVTRVSKNSLFSDLNNIVVYAVTDDEYSDCFGFTEEEVMDALKCQNIDEFRAVKEMYDGFIFGHRKDMYNPWSICNYIERKQLISYWINTSSNKVIGDIIRKHPVRYKYEIERLMAGEVVHKKINENVTFQYLDGDENSLWSLLLAIGYVKADNVIKEQEYTECDISVTNKEVMGMFKTQILGMFENGSAYYNDFVNALLKQDANEMSDILLDITYASMSYFNLGNQPAKRVPENFFHGLVLGLIVSLKDKYRIVSNRESGRGRYDIALYPKQENMDAFIMEFKVCDERTEKSLEQTAENALKQIEEKNYEADLLAAGIPAAKICKLGFAFQGKEVLILKAEL